MRTISLLVLLSLQMFGFFVPRESVAKSATARPTVEFLNSIGVVSTFPDRGQPVEKTIEMLRYGGFRWVRAGIEGLTESGPTTVGTFLDIHKATGVKFSWGLVSTGTDIATLLRTAKVLAAKDALLAFEGNNEPNNWPVEFEGKWGGGKGSWLPLAQLQSKLYETVKADAALARYPVWSISESGAQTDDVGLQFLRIPHGKGVAMADGTRYADYANVHNYIYHPNSPLPADNKTWDAADPSSASRVDGLYGNYGLTWRRGYEGYNDAELDKLPRVTTETGVAIGGRVTERMQALNLLSIYLDQFARGYQYTSVYLLRDRTDEAGNQQYGFFTPAYEPRDSALFLHNLTTILKDEGSVVSPGTVEYDIPAQPEAVHDMLLQQSDGRFQLIVWGEYLDAKHELNIRFKHAFRKIEIYDPTAGTVAVDKLENASELQVTISDHPLIMTLSQ